MHASYTSFVDYTTIGSLHISREEISDCVQACGVVILEKETCKYDFPLRPRVHNTKELLFSKENNT